MRIISGQYKGRKLSSFKWKHIRPTTDKVKETIFNKISNTIQDACVLDLFSGTGSLGLESLSRGACHVDFVDQNKHSVSLIKKNLSLLKVTSQYRIFQKNIFSFLKLNHDKKFDVIFIDPPFTKKIAHQSMESISESSFFHVNSIVIIESGKGEILSDCYTDLNLYDKKEYKDKTISFYYKKD